MYYLLTKVLLYDIFITMNGITTITTKGQVTIPEAVRSAIGAKTGDKVSFSDVVPNYRQVVIKIIPTDIIEELSGSLSTKVREKDYKKARIGAGKLLAQKYKIK